MLRCTSLAEQARDTEQSMFGLQYRTCAWRMTMNTREFRGALLARAPDPGQTTQDTHQVITGTVNSKVK